MYKKRQLKIIGIIGVCLLVIVCVAGIFYQKNEKDSDNKEIKKTQENTEPTESNTNQKEQNDTKNKESSKKDSTSGKSEDTEKSDETGNDTTEVFQTESGNSTETIVKKTFRREEALAQLAIVNPTLTPEEATDVSIVVNKSEHVLYLYNGTDVIAKYTVALSKNPVGKKTKTGDKKVPEGEYYVCTKNDKSKFYLSLGLSYPNAEDAKEGYDNGLITKEEYDSIVAANEAKKGPNWYTNLGGEIMIHGGEKGSSYDWTTGCVAVDNSVMDILWKYCNVGMKVTINP